MINKILEYFPVQVRNMFTDINMENLEEIRLRINKPIILKFSNYEKILDTNITSKEILECLQYICDNSIYAYQNQICNGFITIKGGHRIGITGSCVMEDNRIININYISSLNFRIARQVIGCSNNVLEHVLNQNENTIYNTLIISSPGVRKNYFTKRPIKKYK